MFTALCWGDLTVSIIEKNNIKVSIVGLVMAVLAALGIMHASQLQILGGDLQNQFVVGYIIVALFCILFHYMTKNRGKA
jgi:hypothetical protein